MKNFTVLLILIASVLLFACNEQNKISDDTSADTTILIDTETIADTAVCESLSDEPPLGETDRTVAVPAFLTDEQKQLYLRAYRLYNSMFSGETSAVDYIEDDNGDISYEIRETVVIDSIEYTIAGGRHKSWDSFIQTIYSVFTHDFFAARNTLEDGSEIYASHDGMMCYRILSRGNGYYYNKNFDDEFKLIKNDDNEIIFDVTGHYSNLNALNNETTEERAKRLADNYEYTQRFTITLVNTANGWRFDSFYTASADEWRGANIEYNN